MQQPTRIGEILVRKGSISPAELERALALQLRQNEPVGRILTSNGCVSDFALHQALAEQQRLPFANLYDRPPSRKLLNPDHRDDYLAYQVVPWMEDVEGVITLATTQITADLCAWVATHYGDNIRFAITSTRDIREVVSRAFARENSRDACQLLATKWPLFSARIRPVMSVKQTLAVLILLLAAALWPLQALAGMFIALNLFYGLTLLFKGMFFLWGSRKQRPSEPPIADFRTIPDHELPIYTILVPMYNEAESVPRMIKALLQLDYPRSKLDIKLVLEADDRATFAAVRAANPPSCFDVIQVPPSQPRTKPKACNYALRFARGEYVTIYDAEDHPESAQLRKAVAAFRSLPQEVACLQARLNYYNYDKNQLTRLFAIEYAAWFDFMLKGMEKLHVPLPLGGTSNHMSLNRLRKIAAWDPYNVTEDADLGIRLAITGKQTRMLDSLTLEEAPRTFKVWLAQRSRWIKGYIQTYLVHMRHPLRLWKRLGTRSFLGFQFFIGGPSLVFVSSPFMWALALVWAANPQLFELLLMPSWVIGIAVANLVLSIIMHGVMARVIVSRYAWQGMLRATLLFPFYWALHSLASIKAVWQLMTRPYFWEKTQHGWAKQTSGRCKEMFAKMSSGSNV